MLRTVGINAVLALSGAPVCAKEVRISPFSIGTADEILQGTNSRDRIEGAKAVVRKLTDAGGVGWLRHTTWNSRESSRNLMARLPTSTSSTNLWMAKFGSTTRCEMRSSKRPRTDAKYGSGGMRLRVPRGPPEESAWLCRAGFTRASIVVSAIVSIVRLCELKIAPNVLLSRLVVEESRFAR